jgi:outer membrane receptor protein involved in Fe transport
MRFLLLLLFVPFAKSVAQNVDSLKNHILQEVVITASRLPERVQKSPVSIEVLDRKAIQNSASPSYFDALENIKGLQLITPSLGFKVYNARGFMNPTNVRFVQLVDGIDNQAPHIGSPIAIALAPSDLDVQQVEIVPGVASALYGLNALNGMANIITLNPFENQGFGFLQKTGINHINSSGASAKVFSETSLRFAKKINDRWAYKLNLGYQTGYDWIADNRDDLNNQANNSLNIDLGGGINPGFDGVNSYGNESANRRTLTLNGKKVVVARTGYYERETTDFGINNLKLDGGLFFRPRKGVELSYFLKYSNLDNLYQRTNRFRLEGYKLWQQGFSLYTPITRLRAYMTHENTGGSYNIRSMAENIDRSHKSDASWFSDFAAQFDRSTKAGVSTAEALGTARQFADRERPVPGSETFRGLVSKLGNINNWDVGAALRVETFMYNLDGQFELSKGILPTQKYGIDILVGFDYRHYVVIPDGNYFINPVEANSNLDYYKVGGFGQISKSLWNEKLKISTTIRLDKNVYFATAFNPRFSLVYTPSQFNSLRVSYQSGYRFPSLFEAFSNVNSGGVKRVGGLRIMSEGIFEKSYFKSSIDAFQAAINNDINQNGLTSTVAIEKNKGLLKKNDYTYLSPEHVQSIELGYKTELFEHKLLLDADVYYSIYDGFIAQVEANLAKGQNPDSLAIYFSDNRYQDRYRLWTNSKTKVYNYGASLGLKYLLGGKWLMTSNISYATLDKKELGDGLEEAFNTPRLMLNASFGTQRLLNNWGFLVSYKWQEQFLWQSALATGTVPAYGTLDAQVSHKLKKNNILLKLGGTNILNQYYYNFLAGPSIGGFYYLSAKYELLW